MKKSSLYTIIICLLIGYVVIFFIASHYLMPVPLSESYRIMERNGFGFSNILSKLNKTSHSLLDGQTFSDSNQHENNFIENYYDTEPYVERRRQNVL